MNACVFCQIVANQIPHHRVFQDELITAFEDRAPIAPVHLLIVPNRHIESLDETKLDDKQLLGHMLLTAQSLAVEMNLNHSGYRVIINTGPDAGQSIFHLHLHLLGGRKLSFSAQ